MNSQEKIDFEKWIKGSYLPTEVKAVLSTAADVVSAAAALMGGIVTIVGIVDAIQKLAEFLEFNTQKPDRLQIIVEMVQRIETKLDALIDWDTNAHWTDTLGPLGTASQTLREFIARTNVAVGPRPELLLDSERERLLKDVINPLRDGRFKLLPPPEHGAPAYQQSFFRTSYPTDSAYSGWAVLLPEHKYEERVDAAELGVSGLPTVEPIAWLGGLREGLLVWDPRRALPHILRLVGDLIVALRVTDPAFRTTQRFREEILAIVRALDIMAARWLSGINWTHMPPLDPNFPDSDFSEQLAPVAYDSRSRLYVSHGSEHPETDRWRPMPEGETFRRLRLEYARKVLAYSGFNDFRRWIDHLRAMAELPAESESVQPVSRLFGLREFIGATTLQTPTATLPAKRFHVDWTATIDLSLQAQRPPYDYARGLPIHYAFFLESYDRAGVGGDPPQGPIQQVAIASNQEHIVTMRVSSPTVEVAAEDDGTFGNTSGIQLPPPEFFKPVGRAAQSQPKSLHDAIVDAGAVLRHRPDLDDHPSTNRALEVLGRRSADLFGFVDESPAHSHLVGGVRTTATFGYLFDTHGDLRDGRATFRAWTLKDQPNTGALYLVVEETPPRDAARRIRTLIPVYLNGQEVWYPGFSRRGGTLGP